MTPRNRLTYLLLALVVAGVSGWTGYWVAARRGAAEPEPTPATPDAALDELRAGNLRYVHSRRTRSTDTAHDADDRRRTAQAQHPFATVLTCADSRLCPEFIFDQRVGRVFEVRNAGNVVDDDVLASIEYATEHLHVPLVVVLGHKGCGAIEAVCEAGEKPLPDHLKDLQAHMADIHPQVLAGNHRHDPETVNRLAGENARHQALVVLRESHAVREAADRGAVRVVYGLYDMETGEVTFSELSGTP